ncbi:MAG: transketolase [Clostridia bacterium]|nr:transketolase [Clostridia bacterium]
MEQNLKEICKQLRCDVCESIGSIGVGHIGGSLSIVELLAVLYFDQMHIDPKRPDMPGRDRLICSKGHAGPAVYAALAEKGYFDRSLLLTLNQGGTHLPSHCDMNLTPGIDMTTGSLGQGFSAAVGVALGSRLENDGATIYAIIGDGESQEGQIWESAMFAGNYGLDNLIAFTDCNGLLVDGKVEDVGNLEPLADKWRAFNWNVIEVQNGNDVDAVRAAVIEAKANRGSGKPTMVLLRTTKGAGVSFVIAKGAANHNAPFSKEDAARAIAEIRGEEPSWK